MVRIENILHTKNYSTAASINVSTDDLYGEIRVELLEINRKWQQLINLVKYDSCITSITLTNLPTEQPYQPYVRRHVIQLLAALQYNTSVTDVDLSNNRWIDDDDIVNTLTDSLKINTTLTTIKYDNNRCGNAFAIAMADVLYVNSSIHVLNINNSQMYYSGMEALAGGLSSNSTMLSISIGSNAGLFGDGFDRFLDVVRHTTSLKTISVALSGIDDIQLHKLSDALAINSSIVRIDLDDNRIEPSGIQFLCQSLTINTSIEEIIITRNYIDHTALIPLVHMLSLNSTITKIDLSGNYYKKMMQHVEYNTIIFHEWLSARRFIRIGNSKLDSNSKFRSESDRNPEDFSKLENPFPFGWLMTIDNLSGIHELYESCSTAT